MHALSAALAKRDAQQRKQEECVIDSELEREKHWEEAEEKQKLGLDFHAVQDVHCNENARGAGHRRPRRKLWRKRHCPGAGLQ